MTLYPLAVLSSPTPWCVHHPLFLFVTLRIVAYNDNNPPPFCHSLRHCVQHPSIPLPLSCHTLNRAVNTSPISLLCHAVSAPTPTLSSLLCHAPSAETHPISPLPCHAPSAETHPLSPLPCHTPSTPTRAISPLLCHAPFAPCRETKTDEGWKYTDVLLLPLRNRGSPLRCTWVGTPSLRERPHWPASRCVEIIIHRCGVFHGKYHPGRSQTPTPIFF